jgi:nucleotide-binding universal stress UspA family protein
MVEGMDRRHFSADDGGPPRPVVCAVDDDDLAPRVVETAAGFAERFDAPLTVVHSPYPDRFLTGEPYRSALEAGHAFVERVTEGVEVDEYVVEIGPPEQLIADVADQGAALIVVGNRGRGRLETALRGSVSQAVITNATCPVLAVSAEVAAAARA